MGKARRRRGRPRGGRAGEGAGGAAGTGGREGAGDDEAAGDGKGAGDGGGAGRRAGASERIKAPVGDYEDEAGNVLSLRGSLTAKARREYADTLAGAGSRPADTPEDRAQRALEMLFERLAVRWEIAGAPIEGQRELLQRYRFASSEERASVRRALREHCEERFPDVEVP